jgi:ankyrin repeat protein
MRRVLKILAVASTCLLVAALAIVLVLNKPLRGNRYKALHRACWDGDIEKVHLLLALGADPNGVSDYRCHPMFEFSYPIDGAAWNNHAGIIKLLIDAGASVNVVDREQGSPLCTAAREGSLDAARLLLSAGAKTVTQDGTPIQTVARNFGHEDIAILVEKAVEAREN